MRQQRTGRSIICVLVAAALVAMEGLAPMSAQVRASRRGAVAKGEDAAAAAGPRGAAVKTEEGYAAAGRRGAVVSGEEGYTAVGRRGNTVTGEDIDIEGAAVGRRGAVVVGEEGAVARGRYGNVAVAQRYESYDAWKAIAAVGVGIAIGTLLAKPPAAAKPVVVTQTTYLYHDGVFYTQAMSSGTVVYQVVRRRPGRSSRRCRPAAPPRRSAMPRTRNAGPRDYTEGAAPGIRWSS